MTDDRQGRDQALQVLHDRRESVEVQALLRWARSVKEDAMDRLVTAEPVMVPGLQAKAQLMRQLETAVRNGPARGPHTSRG